MIQVTQCILKLEHRTGQDLSISDQDINAY